MNDISKPEFSHIIHPSELSGGEPLFELQADSRQCADLASRFGIPSLSSFVTALRVKLLYRGRIIRIRGHNIARVTQNCVVTLEPVGNQIDEKFEVLFRNENSIVDSISLDDVEVYEGDNLDLGEIASAELALALDPYPKSESAPENLPEPEFEPGADPEKPNPFAALAALKGRK
jgi:uncharacterized metal-binding protein YceD (DUF177 family)